MWAGAAVGSSTSSIPRGKVISNKHKTGRRLDRLISLLLGVSTTRTGSKQQFYPQTASSEGKKQREGCRHLGQLKDFGREPVNPAPFQQPCTETHSCTLCPEDNLLHWPSPMSHVEEPPESPKRLGFCHRIQATPVAFYGPKPALQFCCSLSARQGWGKTTTLQTPMFSESEGELCTSLETVPPQSGERAPSSPAVNETLLQAVVGKRNQEI